MALLDRDGGGANGSSKRKDRRPPGPMGGPMAGIDRRLLVVALALAVMTLLALLDQYRPTPGSAVPVDWRLPSAELPRTVPMAKAPSPRRDELLGAD